MTDCKHDWWVYSTAITTAVIMVRCKKCFAEGNVKEYTKQEWQQAFYAPSNPYPWTDGSRVQTVDRKSRINLSKDDIPKDKAVEEHIRMLMGKIDEFANAHLTAWLMFLEAENLEVKEGEDKYRHYAEMRLHSENLRNELRGLLERLLS